MRSGNLRHLLKIERPIRTKGSMGGTIKTWKLYKTVRGEIDFSASKQVLAAQQLNSEVIGVIRIRFIKGVTPDMRIKHGDDFYNIDRPINIRGKGRELKISFTSGVNDG